MKAYPRPSSGILNLVGLETSEIPEPLPQSTAYGRLTIAAILALVTLHMLLFLYLVVLGWQLRTLMLPAGDPEIAVRTRTVVANGIWLVANLIAVSAYLLRRQLGRRVLLAVLAFDLVNSVFAAFGFMRSDDPMTTAKWLLLALIPSLALVLLWHQRTTPISAHGSAEDGGR